MRHCRTPVARLALVLSVGAAGLLLVSLDSSVGAQPCTVPESAYEAVLKADPQAAEAVAKLKKSAPDYASQRYEALRALGYSLDCGNQRLEKQGAPESDSTPTQYGPGKAPGSGDPESGTAGTTTTTAAGGTAAADPSASTTTSTSAPEEVEFNLAAIKADARTSGSNTAEILVVGVVAIAALLCAWNLTRP